MDWPDIVLGTMPNINPWIIDNLGESSAVRRRAYAVLIDHLVPPSVNAELSDGLLNLHNDIEKWEALEEGALKEKFRARSARQARTAHLDRDLHLALGRGRLLTAAEIERLQAYLDEIHNETTPVSLHVFGEPPPDKLLVPWLVTCLGAGFLDALGEVVEVPRRRPPALRKAARNTSAQKAEEVLKPFVFQRLVGRRSACGPRAVRPPPIGCRSGSATASSGPGSFRTALPKRIRSSTTCWPPWPAASSPRGRETVPTATRASCPPDATCT